MKQRLRKHPIALTCKRCGSTFEQTLTGPTRDACFDCAPLGATHCGIAGCVNTHLAAGLCASHYRRWKLHGDPERGGPIRSYPADAVCSVEGCDNRRAANEYCLPHYQRVYRWGDPRADMPFRDANRDGRPYINKGGYRIVSTPAGRMLEHRYVMEQQIGRELLRHENVHHKNGDKLDNRPENLELWTVSQTPGQRVRDQLAWARQIIATYEPFEEWL